MLTKKFILSFLIEFGPIIAFFIGTEVFSIFIGTFLLVAGTVFAFAYSLYVEGRVPAFSIVSSLLVLIFGTITLYFKDPFWLVVEYTAYNGIFGAALLIGLIWQRCFLKPLFQSMFHITDRAWVLLSARWSFFFLLTAVLNQVIWGIYGEHAWVYFRVLAGIGLAIFGFSQFFLARKHRHPEASPWGLRL